MKIPGPDSFNFGFLKISWDFIKDDVMSTLKGFVVRGKWSRGSNVSFLCLILKVDNSQQLGDFRPILLVGCLYKIISKALSLKLEKVINKVTNVRQSAFLMGRVYWIECLWPMKF